MTQRQLANKVGTSAASLCRWERGATLPKRDYVELLDSATGSRGKLLRAWQVARDGTPVPEYMKDLSRLEEAAQSIELVSPHLIPGLLQSPGYARLIFEEGLIGSSPRDVDRLVSLRCGRYSQLRKTNDPRVTAIFPQTALAYVPERIRREQAEHLLGLDRVRVHLVPTGTLLWGVTSMLLIFHLLNGETVASSDHVDGNMIYNDPTRMNGLVKQALGAALPADQSLRMIEEML
ncbi:transcriptional regulator with XRE-family HTH domain [Lipingzhangella halophila]|uniref:Transcriptional regulator with XRE-family HTH domain n=1 Tax=Lipingzhangella halophila TaxID=1783352 RepID=A0A7W7RMC4_9ACTN|nr:transcriptional regulator with XRE-family HTH domain [Lipingzhangella halophila]